jgi:hypothetical protein
MPDDSVSHAALVARIDQAVVDFKETVDERFAAHERYEGGLALLATQAEVQRDEALHLLLKEWRIADKRLLDERFMTQTTSLKTALDAQQTALGTALTKADETERRTAAAIKTIDDRQRDGTNRGVGRADVLGWLVAAVTIVGTVLYHFH